MAEKVAIPEIENNDGQPIKPKKKKNKCCTCCLVFLIVILVILAAAFGIGWYFGDKFTKESLDMSLGDTLGVMSDLYWTDDKDVVTNPYSADDVNGFYSQIKRNILLKDSAEVDFAGALDKAVAKYMSSDSSAHEADTAKRRNGSSSDGEKDDSSITDILIDMIADVLDRDHIDIERLNAYDENDPDSDTYIFDLKDKQFAAFVNEVLQSVLLHVSSTESFAEISETVDLKSVIALKQVRFAAQKDGDAVKSTTADVTVWVGLQSAVGQALTSVMKDAGVGWLGWLARGLGNIILPENVYVTLTVPLYGDAQTVVNFNDMNASERARAYKLVNGILSFSGNDGTVDDLLIQLGGKLKPYLEAAADKMPLDNVTDGTIKLDLLSMVTKMASDGLESADPLTKADFLYMLQAMLSDNIEQYKRIEPFRYENYYLDDSGKAVYIDGATELTPIDYEREFINEIENKYAVKFDDDATLADVLVMLGVSLDGSAGNTLQSQELMKKLDSKAFHAALDKDTKDLELVVTDRMLGAAFAEELKNALIEESLGDIKLKLNSITFVEKDGFDGYTFAELALEIDVASSFGTVSDGGLMNSLVSGLMPEKIFLSVTVDITRNRKAGQVKQPVKYQMNSCANTDRAIAALAKVAPLLDMNEVSDMIDEKFNAMFDNLTKVLDIRLAATTVQYLPDDGWTGDGGALVMPDIFTVITQKSLVDKETKQPVLENSEQLKSVLKALDNTDDFAALTPPDVTDNSEFIAQVVDKYYLAPDTPIKDFDALTDFMNDFNTRKFRVYEEDTSALVKGARYIAYDNADASELRPVMDADNLCALLNGKIKDNAAIDNYEIIKVIPKQNGLVLVLAVSVSDLMPDNVAQMLDSEYIYVTADIDTSVVIDNERYSVDIAVNHMENGCDDYNNTLKIVKCFDPDFSIERQIDDVGKTMYEQISDLNKSIAGEDGDGEFISFTADGLVMVDFYTFLANKMGIELSADNGADGKPTSDTLKSVVQGMYERVPTVVCDGWFTNTNNYLPSDILFNPAPDGQQAWTNVDIASFGTDGNTLISDIDFNGLMRRVESIGDGVFAVQTVALNGGTATAARDWLSLRAVNENGETMDVAADYLAVTFKMSMDDFMLTDNDASGLFPTDVYATIVYELDAATGEFNKFDVVFNGMTHDKFAILQELMQLREESNDPNLVNIGTIAARSEYFLSMLTKNGKLSIVDRVNDEGIGEIEFIRGSL